MSIMTAIGAICAALAIVNCLGAMFYGCTGQITPAVVMLLNFAVLGGMVQVGIFG